MIRYKLRRGAFGKTANTQVLTVPTEIAVFFAGVSFEVYKSGNAIVYASGGDIKFTSKELGEYNYEDCRIV